MDTTTQNHLLQEMIDEFTDGLDIVLRFSDTTNKNTIFKRLERVNKNIQTSFDKLTNTLPKKDKNQKELLVQPQLNIVLNKEITKEDKKIQHILNKINCFPNLEIYMGMHPDGYELIDTQALVAYTGVDLTEVGKYYKRDGFILEQGYPEFRSIELMKQLTDSKVNSVYYQILNNPKSTMKEKNKAVMDAYKIYGNNESLYYRECQSEGGYIEANKDDSNFFELKYTQDLTKMKLTEKWKHLDRVFKYYFRNLKTEQIVLPNYNKIIHLTKLLKAKRWYVKYLIKKCKKFTNFEINYGLGYNGDQIRKRFLTYEELNIGHYYDMRTEAVKKVCNDENYFIERYFDFTQLKV